MAYYLYKKIKASRAARQDTLQLEPQSSPFERADGETIASSRPPTLNEKSDEDEAEKKRRRNYRWKLVLCLFLPYFLATIDLTIVATAVPFIASDFDQLSELNWVVTAFTLTSTALIPTFGQLSDVFGRHFVLQLSTFLMLLGSILCAAAQTWGMLLLGRALQGISSSGLMNTVMIILADNVSLAENAKNNSIFAFVGGVAYSIGPVVGGYLADASWRFCFVVSIPIAFVSHIIIFFFLRKELKPGTYTRKSTQTLPSALGTLDTIGTLLFIFGVGLIILGTAWGGSSYPWTSASVLAPIIIGAICFIAFFVYEYALESRLLPSLLLSQKPMLPYSMFKRLDTLWLAILQFATGVAMYSVFYYVGIYFTVVEGYSASKAGVQLLYYIPGLGAGVYLAVLLCNTQPAQTFPPLTFGTISETIGIALVTWAISNQNTKIVNGMMVLAGAGTGIRLMPSTLHAAGVWPDRIAAALSLLRFAQPFGGTLGITIMGSVFNNKFSRGIAGIQGVAGGGVSAEDLAHGGTSSLDFINALPEAVQGQVRLAGKDAIMWAYIAILPILGLSVLTGMFLGNVWIRKGKKTGDEVEGAQKEDERKGESEVIYVPYLWALLKGVERYKHISRPVLQGQAENQESEEAETSQRA